MPIIYDNMIECLAKIIDPEAFGLPLPDRSNEAGGYLTDRDEARARARTWLAMQNSTYKSITYQDLTDGSWAKKWRDVQVQNHLPLHRINHTKDKLYCTCSKGPFKSMKAWSKHATSKSRRPPGFTAKVEL